MKAGARAAIKKLEGKEHVEGVRMVMERAVMHSISALAGH